ncbi:MAG: DNA-binding response regulator [Bacteroidetes bacterium]|nr:MAG: DNA-binding response regulator [Bacteroidota bacterium]
MIQNSFILIVEDNFFNRLHIRTNLEKNGFKNVIEAQDADTALKYLYSLNIDACILDINLGENKKDGIWLGEYLNETLKIPFIYLTAYDNQEIVQKAIHTKPFTFLTKPVNWTVLIANLKLALSITKEEMKPEINRILLRDKKNMLKPVSLSDVLYIQAQGNYLKFITQSGIFTNRNTMKEIEKRLPSYFIRTHRSYIANINHVQGVQSDKVIISNHTIPLSRTYSENFKKSLSNL